ncbi:hypothetical protein [Acuticoccus kandeliae]|uniref:hypothetical protein n=1 Tax=Acuticoccus kandeliae TaxID=2073160 RepID=UPI000D3E21BA|nr:hypothetical protein [Acuticoccus kandeliae]
MTVPGHNGYDREVVQSYIRRHENIEAQILSEKGAMMKKCRDLKADQNAILEEAKDSHGIPKKILRLILKQRDLERKIEDLADGLDDDEADSYDQMLAAIEGMEDTPLGQAALAAAKPKQDDGQTDLQDFTKAEEESDPEVDAFMDKTHAERVAEAAE